jgi:DNA repair protein RadC
VRNTLTIREFPESERPRERLRRYGPNSLSNGELIAILFRTGLEGENVLALGTRVLAEAGGLSGLARVSYDELCEKKGVSEAKACQLLAALELGKRVASLSPDDRPVVRTAGDIAQLLIAEMSVLERERFRVVLLNSKNQVVGIEELYSGSVDTAVVRPAEVFASAVRKTCVAIAVVHNHPSGDPTPSQEDIQITRRLAEAGRSLDIELVDHLIIGQGRWVSLRERGLGSIGARTPEGPH